MHPTDADLSPDERRREIAAIFAAGILRLNTSPGIAPEPTCSVAEDAATQRPDSAEKFLL